MTYDPRPLLARAGLTQTAASRLTGVDDRTMRRYCADPELSTAREMPEPCRRLLALVADVPGVADYLDDIARK